MWPRFPNSTSSTRGSPAASSRATPWWMARAWRGAFEGWMRRGESFFGHVKKTLTGLRGFYMAGQWVEPGGGIPMAVMSGRQALQLACADEKRPFVAGLREAAP
jgi:phytoene dehydrogenase-like protein